MNQPNNIDPEHISVPGFETPSSPEASYNNLYVGFEELEKEPPFLPTQLLDGVLNKPPTKEPGLTLPKPDNAALNHLYVENTGVPKHSVVALGVTHRFRSKYVTVVLYKPVPRR